MIFGTIITNGCADSFLEAQNYLTGPVNGVGLKKTTSIVSGETEQLYAVVIPSKTANKNITWSSSDETAASVDQNGLVTAVAVVNHDETRETTITVITDESGFSASCVVTVIEKPIPVTSVSLNKTATVIQTGNFEKLFVSFIPSNATNQNITWTSSAGGIASVDNIGYVSGTTPGLSTITATSSTADGVFTASAEVTVEESSEPVTGVALAKEFIELGTGETFQLIAGINPSDATNQALIWTSSDSTKASVNSSGVVTGVADGTPVITVKTVDGA